MTTPLVMGLSVAAAALSARSALQYYQVWKLTPRLRKFYEGGFEEKMDRREAALILGLRESAARSEKKVKDAHRRIMTANHPDSGGSGYIASKVNEAKDVMLGKKGGSDASTF